MPYAKINDLEMYYEIHGDGPPLLLVAGLASDSQSWISILPALSAKNRVIVFDNRGVGRTMPQDAVTSISQMAEDCMGLARYLGLEKFDLLGHSMGGFIALELAARYPQQIDRLIIASAVAIDNPRNNWLFQDWAANREAGMDLARWFRNFFYWIFTPAFFTDPQAVENAVQFALEYPYPQNTQAFTNQVKALVSYDGEGKTDLVQAKTLVLAGSEDLLFSPKRCEEFSKTIQQAKFKAIDHAAHSIFIENPKDFVTTVQKFLHNSS